MDEFEKFYNKALRFLSFRPRSEYEVTQNLSRKNASENIISKVVSRLKENNFINDEEFIKWWIEQRIRFRPRSLKLIKIELRQKGIDKELIEETISHLPSAIDDLESAKELIDKRLPRYKNLSQEEKFQKIARFLSSKGFSYDIIKEIFKNITSASR